MGCPYLPGARRIWRPPFRVGSSRLRATRILPGTTKYTQSHIYLYYCSKKLHSRAQGDATLKGAICSSANNPKIVGSVFLISLENLCICYLIKNINFIFPYLYIFTAVGTYNNHKPLLLTGTVYSLGVMP